MTAIDLTLGERLRVFRERAGLNPSDIAEVLEVSRRAVWTWETDRVVPKRIYLREMAQKYGVPPELLLPPKVAASSPVPGVGDHKIAGRESITDNKSYVECHLDRDSYYHSTSLLPGGADAHSYQYYRRRVLRQTFCVAKGIAAVEDETGRWITVVRLCVTPRFPVSKPFLYFPLTKFTRSGEEHGAVAPIDNRHVSYTQLTHRLHRKGRRDFDPEIQPIRSTCRSHLRRARPASVPTARRERQLSRPGIPIQGVRESAPFPHIPHIEGGAHDMGN